MDARLEDGTLLTEARRKFIVISKEIQREVEEYFNF